MRNWLRFFRAVNLPTVPGDVLVGASALCAFGAAPLEATAIVAVCVASVALYMFGLADNDIVGAASDSWRPLSDGSITMPAARVARGLCLAVALVTALAAGLPAPWWTVAFILAVSIVVYNRTKWFWLMGMCRGLNVVCGGAAVCGAAFCKTPDCSGMAWLLAFAAIWTLYVAAVTKYSEGEELDSAKKRRVGFLIGGIVYLQLVALLVCMVRPLLVAGAVLLIALRVAKRHMTGVCAS